MIIELDKENNVEAHLMKEVYCNTMMELAENDKGVVEFDADLAGCMEIPRYKEKYPEKAINCGIQEANMCGVAAGMAAVGFIPFLHTFACFATRRMYDQIFISGAYSKSNLKIIGSDPGISAEFNGGTHMSFEDIALMRAIPEMTILDITDTVMLKDILTQIKDKFGMYYLRVMRKSTRKVYGEGSVFEIGKSVTIKQGNDVTIIASGGYCVAEAITAAKILEEKNISARVIDMFTIKPIDKEAIIKAAKETGAIVTSENHNILNGLGSAVAEVIIENCLVPVERIGVNDQFGEVGPMCYLSKKFKMTAEDIVEKCQKAISRK